MMRWPQSYLLAGLLGIISSITAYSQPAPQPDSSTALTRQLFASVFKQLDIPECLSSDSTGNVAAICSDTGKAYKIKKLYSVEITSFYSLGRERFLSRIIDRIADGFVSAELGSGESRTYLLYVPREQVDSIIQSLVTAGYKASFSRRLDNRLESASFIKPGIGIFVSQFSIMDSGYVKKCTKAINKKYWVFHIENNKRFQ